MGKAIYIYGGRGGFGKLTIGKYDQLTTCTSCNMETCTTRIPGTHVAPLIYESAPDYLDISQSLALTSPPNGTIRKRFYTCHSLPEDTRESAHSIRTNWAGRPDVAVVHFLRFDTDGRTIVAVGKDMTSPDTLDLAGAEYAMCSVVEHVGASSASGHYYAFGKCPEMGIWYKLDDASTSVCPLEDATSSPHIAFYQIYCILDECLSANGGARPPKRWSSRFWYGYGFPRYANGKGAPSD